jgi:hypothetical protein
MQSGNTAVAENTDVKPEIERAERYRMSVAEYKSFRQQGFLVVRVV